MAQVRSWAGLDVHARSVLAVTMDAASGELRSRRLPGDTGKVVEFCGSLPGPTRGADRVWAGSRALGGRCRVRGRGTGEDRAAEL
jgi:hypothetical protein